MSTEPQPLDMEAVAIIGMSCRFPGASSVEQFWQNLQDGVESITFFSDAELERASIDPAELGDPKYVKARGLLEDLERFDARFFGFSPREAELTDPQQRVFLECAWEAFERAGYEPSAFPGPIGVFAGAGANHYLLHHLAPAGRLVGTANAFQTILHNKNDHLATRVAYKLDLKGPSISVQTACSTSLVAVVLASQSLLSHQCDMALAGGVSLTVPQRTGYLHNERGIGSPDGHCRAFDAKAQGTVAGNGAGVVLLKRLSEALADGDTIHAVIRGGALNNDGAAKVGYTAPSVSGQQDVIALAQALAGVTPDSISYVEAHGTGTSLGDPIEVKALTLAFQRQTQRTGFCALGSVKTNLGHLDTAAGIAGLIKTTLALEHRRLPPSLHFETPNPEIDFAQSPFYVNARLRDWEAPAPRRAGVSAFGLGGTNAHVVVEEAPVRGASGPSRPFQLLLLSARSGAALEAMTTRLAEHLKQHPTLPLADVAYTLAVGRRDFDHRRFVVCRDTEDAAVTLATLHPERVLSRTQEPTRRSLVFLFPGQGSQHPGMAADLYASEAVFREEVDRCLEALRRRHDLDLRSVLFPSEGGEAHAAARLEQTALTQPALFVIEYALARLLQHWGLQPGAMLGHSVGELVAACLSGVFSLDDALDLVALRGHLLQACPPGAMLSVQLPERELNPLLSSELEIAAVNGPSSCVVAGSTEAIAALERRLSERAVPCRRLRTSHAFHCKQVEAAVAPFREAVARVRRSAPTLRFLSCVTGTWITPEQAMSPDYWAQHLRKPVRFAEGLEVLLQEPDAVLLEVGPGRALRTLARWHPRKKPGQAVLPCLPSAEEQTSDVEHLLRTVGQLWLLGVTAPGLFAGEQRHRQTLPTYPFERQRHWVEPRSSPLVSGARQGSLEKRADLASWFYVPVWKESAPLPVARAATEGTPRVSWLLLVDETGLGARVAARLRQSGGDVVEARRARAFRRTGADTFEVAPTREGYAALLSELHTEGRAPQRIVHCFGLTSDAAGASSEDVVARSFYSLLFLAQALGRQGLEQPVSIVALSNGMQEVTGDDLVWPEQATVLGPVRVIPREYPRLHCRSVDVTLPPSGGPRFERLAELIATDVASEVEEPSTAYRGGRRWVQGFDTLRPGDGAATPPLRERGTYLITGGLGGIGLALAESFAERVRARLVLTARTALPPREAWPQLLEDSGTEDTVRRRIRAVLSLEERGAEVIVCRADVTDLEAMRGVMAATRERFGALHGVIHAAGVPGGGLIQLKSPEAAAVVLAPKVRGTQVLMDALEGTAPDFFVACSSLSSVVGRLGQVDYTAGNAFLDAAVRAYHARTGVHAVAVNWGAWEEVGMAARKDAALEQPLRLLPHPLLHRCLEDTPERLVFASDIGDARSRWVVDEHRILGTPTVPGVAWFELVRAALSDRAGEHVIELFDTFFLFPLRVPDGETREVRLVIEQEAEGYRWVVRSQPADGTGKATAHVTGRARFLAPMAPRTLDLEAIRRRCEGTPDSLEAEYEEDLGPRWRSVRQLHLGKGELLLVLELQPEFASDLEHMRFHPSLMDRTSGMAKSFLAERGYYLPFGYGRLRFLGALPRRIHAHARFLEHAGADGETRAFDVVLTDEEGRVLVEVERLTQKRVNDPAAELRALAAARSETLAAAEPSQGAREEILPREGVAALELLLAARVMPQVVVSVRDLQATIANTDEVVRERIAEAVAEARTGEALQPRPNLKTGYVPPRTGFEQKLAAAWEEVLGIDRVGIHDDFFELGGDSVQAIQIMARGSRLGLQLDPEQFFQTSTIAELGRVLEGMLTRQAEQGPVMGPVPLTPEQRRLLEVPPEATARASRVLTLDLPGPTDAARVAGVLNGLLTRHDALRHRFLHESTDWRQEGAPPSGDVPVVELDLGTLAGAEHAEALRAAALRIQAALDPSRGPLLAAALVQGTPGSSRLLLAGHDLVIDGTSWRILAEDVSGALRSNAGDGARPKTWPFKRWAEQLTQGAVASGGDVAPRKGAVHELTASLSADETRTLQEKLTRVWRADLGEALLVSFASALAAWTEGRVLHLDFIHDGRDAFEGVDCSRTVGCFDVSRPLRIELPEGADEATLLKGIKEEVRRPSPQESGSRRNEMGLRLLGGNGAIPEGLSGRGLSGGRLLEFEGFLAGDRLHVRCTHDGDTLPTPAPERLLADVLGALRALCAGDQEARSAISPTDFPHAGLDASQMDTLALLIDQIDEAHDP
ncbi:type I polyketide synthase [Corallococcus llansteffanensis]|uniref:Phenolphthiocerol/phthiocerol polyketide synthase subunit E n=1 Tax=Corallococcus llansteffanensis TaxID=2316731 RepID=A0A3A8PVD8_9BACT|nr:type I polyketide synthase [Corallococcus llansteffanensis]RKH60406.1 SDR family NAD(P)-dependent oxidoreductase [Corallococcus llansteffanensis]